MNRIVTPVAAAAVLLLTTSCGEDTLGTSFEVTDANYDESVNPAHIRGYHTEEPDMGGAPFKPNQYYPFSTRILPPDLRQQLEGNIAVRMVTIYYSPDGSLRDLAEEYNPSGAMGNTPNSPADTGGGGGTGGGSSTGSGNGNSGNGSNSGGSGSNSGNGTSGSGTGESGDAGGNNSGSTDTNDGGNNLN
ncbi:hypothetical protein [Pontibacter litorisediminis]|uniref:hypothetical protein n=1 Tax=Pontibacter litorisediminis TaxID=1846260 RepID=UPI0023EDEA0C|nr:hypothetical protein [Pontibacter litorisediminis]